MTTKTAAAALLLSLSAAGVHGQAPGFDPAQTCEGKAEGAECWHQLDSHAGCYVWNNGLKPEQTVSWTGACNGSEGEGVLTWADPAATTAAAFGPIPGTEGVIVSEGALVGGKLHGRASVTSGDGTVAEGFYANGLRSGRWRFTSDRGVAKGIYANGRQAGRWVYRFASGTVTETPYVNDEIHGTEVRRTASGTVTETPYVNGEVHGTRVERDSFGIVTETPYVNSKKHGTKVERWENDRRVTETPYVNGKIHGTEVERWSDGKVTETPWVNGQRHGTEVRRNADGTVARIRYVNGERQDP